MGSLRLAIALPPPFGEGDALGATTVGGAALSSRLFGWQPIAKRVAIAVLAGIARPQIRADA